MTLYQIITNIFDILYSFWYDLTHQTLILSDFKHFCQKSDFWNTLYFYWITLYDLVSNYNKYFWHPVFILIWFDPSNTNFKYLCKNSDFCNTPYFHWITLYDNMIAVLTYCINSDMIWTLKHFFYSILSVYVKIHTI